MAYFLWRVLIGHVLLLEAGVVKTIHIDGEKPPKGWVKINTDGSVIAKEWKAACGGLIRNDDGVWLIGFSKRACTGSVLKAMGSFLVRLRLAKRSGFNRVILECDSKCLVEGITSREQGATRVSLMLERKIWRVNGMWNCPAEGSTPSDGWHSHMTLQSQERIWTPIHKNSFICLHHEDLIPKSFDVSQSIKSSKLLGLEPLKIASFFYCQILLRSTLIKAVNLFKEFLWRDHWGNQWSSQNSMEFGRIASVLMVRSSPNQRHPAKSQFKNRLSMVSSLSWQDAHWTPIFKRRALRISLTEWPHSSASRLRFWVSKIENSVQGKFEVS